MSQKYKEPVKGSKESSFSYGSQKKALSYIALLKIPFETEIGPFTFNMSDLTIRLNTYKRYRIIEIKKCLFLNDIFNYSSFFEDFLGRMIQKVVLDYWLRFADLLKKPLFCYSLLHNRILMHT